MIFKPSSLHKFFFTYICPRFYGGAPATPSQTTQTVNQNTIPAELMPYVKNMLNRAEPLSQSAYVPYSTNAADYVAPFSPLQKQAQAGAANLQTPSQFAPATQMAGVSGIGQLGTAGQALGYGAQGAGYGQTAANVGAMGGLGYGAQSADLGMQAAGMAGQGYGAGAQYAQQATSPTAIGAYMNPYIQQSLAPQLQLLNQQYGIKQAQQQGAATQAGAFGGSREALQGGLINQGQALAQQEMIAQGYNQAFGQAQQAQQFGANLGLQGMQAGNQAMQTGLQGLGQGLTGVNTALQGYQQGMAGSQAGLAGVQGAQQGFTGAANTAATLGNLGTAQLGAETSVLGTQAQFGAQQQAQQQQAIDQAVLNYQNAQQYPYMQLGFMSNLLRGTPINNTTETQYMAQPSAMQQIGGALGTAGSLYGAYTAKKAEGGRIQDNSYAKGGIVGYLEGGSVEESMRSKLEDLDVSHLQQIVKSNESPEMSKLAKEVLATKFAKGGIVAFANGGQSQDWKSALENISQEMTARDYKLHGWTDEDIINYKSSGRVPLDPKKQLALRTPEAAPRIPLDKDIYYNRLQEKGRRVPEDKVIRLPDENAVKPNTFEPVSQDKGITGYRPAAEYESPQYGGELGAPPKEGEYIPSEKSTARGAIGAPEQEPIEGRKMYYDETKAYKDAMEQRRADMARGKKPPMNAGMAREELLKKKKMAMETPVERPEGATAEGTTAESATAEGSPKATSKGLTAIKGLAPVALKTLGTLSLPELVDTMTGQPEDSKTFKEYDAIKKKSGMKGVLAHMNEQVAEGNAKVAKGIAAFASENIAEPVKEWWSGEEGQTQQPVTPTAVTPSAPAGIDSQAQAPLQKQESPYSADAYNPMYTQRKQPAVTPPVGSAGQGIVQKEQPSFGGTPEESEILRANLASEPESVAQAVNTAAEVANAKTEQDMGFYQKQVAEMYKQAGLGNNEGAAAMRKEIMDELANKEANEKRQTYLRMAEFFSHWGSTPGAPLAAGMKSLIATMPGYLEDKKDQEKLQRGLQDSLYKLDQADRLEKIGMIKEAAALKHEASQFDKEVMKLQHEAVQNRLQEAAAERRAKIMAGASTTNAVIGATSRIDGTTSDTYRGNNIKALQNQATNITRQMANLLPESKELPGLKAQLKNVNDRMDALIDESGAKPKTRYDRWLTETGKI
jgi:hypothetical protein